MKWEAHINANVSDPGLLTAEGVLPSPIESTDVATDKHFSGCQGVSIEPKHIYSSNDTIGSLVATDGGACIRRTIAKRSVSHLPRNTNQTGPPGPTLAEMVEATRRYCPRSKLYVCLTWSSSTFSPSSPASPSCRREPWYRQQTSKAMECIPTLQRSPTRKTCIGRSPSDTPNFLHPA